MIELPRATGKCRGRGRRSPQGHATAVFCGIVNQDMIHTCENILAGKGPGQLGVAGMDGVAGEEPLRW